MDTAYAPATTGTAPSGVAPTGIAATDLHPVPLLPVAVPARPAKNPVATAGLAFAVAGLVLGLIPFACFFAWFLALPALVLGIVGATRKDRPRRRAGWAIGLSAAGWAASIAMSWVTFAVFGTVSVSAGA